MWCSGNSDKHNNSEKNVPLSVTSRYQEGEKVLFMIWGDQSLGSQSRKTGHSSTRRCNDGDEISEGKFMEVSLGE